MSYWRPSTVEESQLEDLAAKGLLPPKAVAHWRALPVENEEPQHDTGEIVSLLAFHEHSLGRKKTAKKAKRRQVKEMEIARRVRMGEDRDAVQEEYESEPLTDSDDGDRSKEEGSVSGDADSLVAKLHSLHRVADPRGVQDVR
ncbi:hypothetical protein C2845_PM08G14020 [Panicum miliaceum]|uniref:Uncharacterized protein n=1 Tax=Panicum miliaceum TaxID=4540 RepID=A0A3L6QYF5_PANMI|nr:hypothetical protein C2845_PM08G14020 [Panicum miliaceum]